MAEYQAAIDGYTAAHAPKEGGDAPSVDEAEAALAEEIAAGRVTNG